jgi:hypothetical protein
MRQLKRSSKRQIRHIKHFQMKGKENNMIPLVRLDEQEGIHFLEQEAHQEEVLVDLKICFQDFEVEDDQAEGKM